MTTTAQTRSLPRAALAESPPRVVTYLHRGGGWAWFELTGDFSTTIGTRSVLHQLRRAQVRLPVGIGVVGIDLSQLSAVSIDLAVLLCVERRILDVRDVTLAAVLRGTATASPSTEQILEQLPTIRNGDDRLARVIASVHDARRGAQGWESVGDQVGARNDPPGSALTGGAAR